MQQVVAQYMRPMDKATTPKPVFDNRDLLFSNFKQICEFHTTGLLEGIKYYAEEPRMLGRALLRMEREFDKHVAYCRDEPKAQELLKNDPVVSKYFKVLAEKVGDDKGLTEHLKLPIQRINDYQLLLKELVKYSKRLGDDCTDLQKALELFLGVPNRATNNLFIDSIEGYRGNIYKLGRLLTHDWFTVDFGDKPKNKYLFLFKARLLICEVVNVGDGRSVFVLQYIVKLPEVELLDVPGTTKFELHKKDPPLIITLKATKESAKTAWLREIRLYATDLVALAEHAADDLQVLSPPKEESPEPSEEKRKREPSEDNQVEERQEKKSRVEEVVEKVTDVLAGDESSHVSKTKRKTSVESEVASKISKTEVTEVSISQVQETQNSISAASEVTTDLETKSFVTQVSEVESVTSQSQVSQQIVVQASETAVSQVEIQQGISSSISVQSTSIEQSDTAEIVKKEKVSKTRIEVKSEELNSESLISSSQQKANLVFEKSSIEQSQLEQEAKVEETPQSQESVSYSRRTSKTSVEQSGNVEKSAIQTEVLVENKSELVQQQISTEKEETKTEASTLEATLDSSAKSSVARKESVKKSKNNSKVTSPKKSELLETQKPGTENKENVNPTPENTSPSNGGSGIEESLISKTKAKTVENSIKESENTSESTASTRKSVKSKKLETTEKATEELSVTKKVLEEEKVNNQPAEKSSQAVASSDQTVNTGVSEERVLEESQTETTEDNAEGEMSRYSRSSRLSGEYSSSSRKLSSGGRYESSSTYDSTGISSIGRRESGSRIESSRYESGGALEGAAASRYESKYSTSSRTEGGSKYGIESSYESKEGSKYAIESSLASESKLDSIASKYGLGSETQISGRSSKHSVESSNDGNSGSTTKRGSIASKYGIGSNSEVQIEGRSSKYSVEASYDGDSLETSSKLDSIASKYGLGSETQISGRSSKHSVESSYDGNSGSTTKRGSIASKYGIGSNSEVQIEGRSSKYSVEASYDGDSLETSSKLDSIASKYGLGSNETKTEGRSSKYTVQTSYDGSEVDTTSKIDSIASKYGRNSITDSAKVENRSTKVNVGTNFDGNINGESKMELKYSSKNKEASESKFSKKSILSNGSVTGEYESTKTITRSESDGKPIFTKTLEGQDIEPGENAIFEVACEECPDEIQVTWLKDNKPFNDRLMDRVNMMVNDGTYRLQVMHCREDDSGTYTAIAENVKGNAHCTAQLSVYELTTEERKRKNALNAPYFLVALKDTEILLNTYLRFMIKVKGNPNPEVKFYRDGKEITTSDGERLSIVRTRADRGCYELVIADVCAEDAGVYSCNAMNIYGDVVSEAKVTVVDDKNIFGELLPGGEGLLAKGEKAAFTWKKDGADFDPEERFKVLLGDDEDSLALVFQHVKPEDAGLYTCVAKTSTGNISCSAELTVQGAVNYLHREPQKPELVIEHKEAIVSCGGSAMLELVCKGYPKPNVVFKHEGKVVEADARHKFLFEDDENMSLVIKNVTTADAGEYHVIASNDLGEDTTTMNLVVKQAPKIKKKIENQTCMVDSTHEVTIEIEGSPSPDVSFYKDGVEIKSSERITIVKESEEIYKIIIKGAKLTDTGSYSVVAKNEVNQCSDFWQWHVTSPPKIIKKLGADKVCNEKETVTFEVQTEADPAPTVTWYKNKTELKESSAVKITTSGSAHSLVVTSAARADSGEYSCEIRNVHGSSSDSCLLNVRCAPQFTNRLQDTTAAEGDVNVEFAVDVDAFPTPDVKWYLGDVEITEKKSVYTRVDNGSSHKLVLKEVTSELSGQYTCKVSNEMGQDSCQATFTVNRKPRITKSLIDMSVDVGQTLKLEVEVEGCPEPRIKWYKDGQEVTTDARIKIERDTQRLENYHLTVTLIKEEDGGEYEVRAENEMGSVSSKSTVTVHSRVIETVTTFKSGDDGSIIVSKVSSSLSHGAIITGPAETRTIHKMTSSAVYYDDDDEYDKKIVKPNKPHTTSLEVEEIASHSYYLTELGYYTIPDHIRRGTYGIIEEPQTDSDADSRHGRQVGNRTISIKSVSEDEMSWQNEPLSREISIEDLSKSLFDIDDTKKFFSKDSYVRQSSFKEDYFTDKGDEESVILKEKSQKVYENDITEKLIHISKEFDENEFKNVEIKIDNIRNRIIEELVLSPIKNFDSITKDTAETTLERKKKSSTGLFSVDEEGSGDIEELLRRSQRERSILDDILNEEEEKAPPKLKESTLKDGHTFESLPLVYTVEASGTPKPTVRWLHEGQEVKPDGRVHITNEGDLYKLEIVAVDMKDAGKWQCEIINDLGKQSLQAELSVSPESELRKPKFTAPLEASSVMQREPVTMKAVCTADPLPHVAWLLNGEELAPDIATLITSMDSKELEHGLKECVFSLNIPTSRHADTGEYTIQAKNKYGIGECSARLDILLRPEVEPLKDVTTVPFEETSFFTNIRANPVAEVKWSKDGYVIQPSAKHEIIEDREKESFRLVLKNVSIEDAGLYTVSAKNEHGETTQQARLNVHTDKPSFIKPLQKQIVKDYEDCTLRVRCDGVPKPNVKWFLNEKEITNDDRHTITTVVGGQVDSELEIKHFNASDSGKYKVVAFSVSGEAECQADIILAQIPPGFGHKLDRQKEVDEGEPLELRTKVDGSPIPTAKWFKDGVELSPSDEHVKQTCLPDGTVKLSIDHVTPADCGAYKLLITNPSGEHMALCAVAVNPTPRKPSFSEELENVKVVVGQPVKLQARVMAFPAPEVKWFKDGVPIRPSQAVNFINQPGGIVGLSIDSCRPEDAGSYSLTVTNKLGDVASKANVEIGQKERKPAFIAELYPTKVIEGFPVKLEVKVLGHPQPTIKWTHNGKEIVPDGKRIRVVSQPDGTHSLLISEATPADAGSYSVIATNDKGETATKADLTVASREDSSSPQERPQFIHGLREVSGEEGQPLTVTAPFTANPVPQVTWTKDGQPLSPNERILLTCDGKRVGLEINPLELPDAGVYGVKLVNPLGEDSTEGKINVRKVFQPPRFTQKFTDLQQLPTFDAKFPARVTGIPAPEITWYKNNVPLKPSDKYTIKRDGDACCLYVRDLVQEDAGQYKCVAKNKEGEDSCEAVLEVVDKIGRKQKVEPPTFLKKIGDADVYRGLSAKFTACATGTPEPDVEWFRNDQKIFPSDRIRIEQETTGLLRLTIGGVTPEDVGTYRCRIFNPHGEESCTAQLVYDTLEPQKDKKPISEQYSDFDKMKRTGVPMPLTDKPIISRMADRHLTLSWRPSIPHQPRFPVTYQVEMCEVPDGDWFTARTGLRSCVCDIRNLEPFRDYKFRVRVENKYGVSDPSPFAITHRAKLEPDPPKFIPYLQPGIDFRPETSPYFPKDFDIERPPHDGYAQPPKFLLQEYDSQYGVKGHNVNLFWFVYGYPKPKMEYLFNDEPIEIGGRYDWSYTRNGQATLFINKMLERDVGWYEAIATNEHGQARQRVRLELAEYPAFIRRPEETVVLQRRTARMEARVTGVPYPDIKWYKDWQPIAASSRIKMQFIEPDTHILVITDAILKDEGLYSVSARNVAGSVSSSAMLHVEESEHEYSARIREYPPRIKPSAKPFGDYYDLGDELGRGVQGVVYHAAERQSGRNYAAKIMHGHSELKPFMKNELDIMNLLNDRHLIRLYDAYEHDHTLALVTELAAGGELVRDRLLRSQGYTEREVAGYIRQLLHGLKHMHDNSVAHLGLTIGELLLSHAGSDELKICDFGLSRRIQLNKHAALDFGMPEFVAPEVANGEGVAFGADMWSVGIITYILLSGYSPFRCRNDRETLTKIREGKWEWHDEEWWSRFSKESRDFISKLLVINWHDRMDVNTALSHPWLSCADKIYKDEYTITTDRLRNYYNLYKEWMSNAQCRNWFRRRPLSGAFDHPSKMVYPPGTIYTPEGTPERDRPSHERQPNEWDLKFKQWEHPDWEVSATSESHYQNGPDTYLLQLRDTQFPVRLREYMKVACIRSPGYSLNIMDTYDPRTPIIRERRRFTDIMDEEIDDERRERINNYGSESYTIRRLRHELGTRLDSYAEAQAFMESKKDGQLPFFREKPQVLPVQEGDQVQLSCFAVGDPKPSIQWFKNDMVIAEGQRIKIIEDEEGRSTLKFDPAMHHDIGFYKVVARNKVGQTVARTRIVEATTPDAPDSPTATEISDTEILLRWKQPKYDGNSPVVCYSLQYREGDKVEWKTVAENIDHEFFVVRNLQPDTSYHFRLSSRNRIGWSEKGIPTELIKTKQSGTPKIEVTKAMHHLQQITESGQEIILDEDRPKLDYAIEENPVEWDTTTQNLADRYTFISELWRGKFSTVVKGVDKNTDEIVVAKILEIRPETEVQVQREFNCIRKLRHERISNLLAAYQLPGAPVATLILEKLQGADVLTYLSSCHDYNEQMVATIITQVLDGLQYLHWRGYCHLDLQPDNVVMSSVRSIHVKLIDFGSAHRVTKLGTSVPQAVGELEYKSPEVINDEPAYPQTDIWSVGVLTYILLSGVSPFRGADDAETKQNISFVRFRFEHLYKELTQEATRFLMWVFKKVPLKRPTAEECHEHRWLAQSDFIQRKRERAVFLGNRLKEFADEYHEKKAREASQTDVLANFGPSPRVLARSNSITDELLTNFSSR
ncbi:obscurin isoform X4 [Maniola hyperantus]|uniref:obscurin isoform X4 n=1 Tax=Aphantopus hyperantus TaxID=2795564 RepID=UPI003747A0A2